MGDRYATLPAYRSRTNWFTYVVSPDPRSASRCIARTCTRPGATASYKYTLPSLNLSAIASGNSA